MCIADDGARTTFEMKTAAVTRRSGEQQSRQWRQGEGNGVGCRGFLGYEGKGNIRGIKRVRKREIERKGRQLFAALKPSVKDVLSYYLFIYRCLLLFIYRGDCVRRW